MKYQFRVSRPSTGEVQYVTTSTEEATPDEIRETLLTEFNIKGIEVDLVGRNDGSGWETVN
jgi:hypothetical protein